MNLYVNHLMKKVTNNTKADGNQPAVKKTKAAKAKTKAKNKDKTTATATTSSAAEGTADSSKKEKKVRKAVLRGKAAVDATLCVGCEVCSQLCPKKAFVSTGEKG